MRPGRHGIRPSTDITETLLPEPDSPTTPSDLAREEVVADAGDGMHDAVLRVELDRQVLIERIGSGS